MRMELPSKEEYVHYLNEHKKIIEDEIMYKKDVLKRIKLEIKRVKPLEDKDEQRFS